MDTSLLIGTQVRLKGVPDWLIHDLPKSEQAEIISFIGKVAVVQEIDQYGYIWLGFGACTDAADARYHAHQ